MEFYCSGSYSVEEPIKNIVTSGNALLLFTQNQIHRATVSDPQIQFEILPLAESCDYVAGAIEFQAGVYFLSQAGVKFLPNGAINPEFISHHITNDYRELISNRGSISVAKYDKLSIILWFFPNSSKILIWSTLWANFQIIDDIKGITIGEIYNPYTTIDALTGTIDNLLGSIDSLSDAGRTEIILAIDELDKLTLNRHQVLETGETVEVWCNIRNIQEGRRGFVRWIECPEITGQWTVELVTEQRQIISPGRIYSPNRQNRAMIYKPLNKVFSLKFKFTHDKKPSFERFGYFITDVAYDLGG